MTFSLQVSAAKPWSRGRWQRSPRNPAVPTLTRCASSAARDGCRQAASLGCVLVMPPPCWDFTRACLENAALAKVIFRINRQKHPPQKPKLPLWLHVIVQDLFDADWSLVINMSWLRLCLRFWDELKNHQINHIAVIRHTDGYCEAQVK